MLLHADQFGAPMRLVYELSEDLASDPEQVALAQALTNDASRPHMGLKGEFGLFGSDRWWANIKNGILPTKQKCGEITRLYSSGQDSGDEVNAIDILLDDGSVKPESIYVNKLGDLDLYKVGSRICILYAYDPLKIQRSSGDLLGVSEIVIEVAVST